MNKKWSKVKLGEALEALIDYRGKTPQKSNDGIPLVTAKIIKDGFIQEPNEFLSPLVYEKWMKRGFPAVGDVVLTSEAPLGEVGFVRDSKIGLAQRVFTLRGDGKQLDTRFLKYYLQSRVGQSNLVSRATGTTVRGIKQAELRKLVIEKPDIRIQKDIASIITKYENLIVINDSRVSALEILSRDYYKSMFVNKEPSNRISSLGEFVEIKKGRNITRSTSKEGLVPVVAGGLEPAYYHNIPNTKGPVITVSASGANAGFVNLYHEDIWASDCSYIDSTMTSYLIFIYLFLKTNQSQITNLQKGSAQPHVYPKDLMRLEIVIPERDLLEEFTEKVNKLYGEIAVLKSLNKNLTATRDLLIDNLITGKRELKK